MAVFIRQLRIGVTAIAATVAIAVAATAGATEPASVAIPEPRAAVPQSDPAVERSAVASPAVAAEEKPGASQAVAIDAKDPKQTAAESAHVRGFASVMNDAYLTARVKASLAIDSSTPATDINVDTENAEVTLFGIVPNDDAKTAAEADARAIAGVAQVINDLQVVAEDRKSDVMARDSELRGSLEKSLQPFPSMTGVSIDVKNCVVRLTGTVRPGEEHDTAMQAVRATPGVCLVKDQLKFAAS